MGLEQELIAEEEARGKKTTGGEQEEPPRKFTVKGVAEVSADFDTFLKSLKLSIFTLKDFLSWGGMIMVPYLLTSKSIIKKKKQQQQANHHGHISEKERHLKKSLRQVLGEVFQKKALLS